MSRKSKAAIVAIIIAMAVIVFVPEHIHSGWARVVEAGGFLAIIIAIACIDELPDWILNDK